MPEIFLYGDISPYDVSAKKVIAELDKYKDEPQLTVRINSQGGDVIDGYAIYNAFTRFKGDIVFEIDAMALSVASVIPMAGKQVNIAENGIMMAHEPWLMTAGTASDLRKKADVLERINEASILAYGRRVSVPEETVREWLSEEKWFSAQEAVEYGLADNITEPLTAKQYAYNFDPKKFKNVPGWVEALRISEKTNIAKQRLAQMGKRILTG